MICVEMVASKSLHVFALKCQSQLRMNKQNCPALLLNNKSGKIMSLDLINILETSNEWSREEYKIMDGEENHASAK